VTSGGTAGHALPVAVSEVSSGAAGAPSIGPSDHVDHGAHHNLVFHDGTGADSNFFWVNSNGDFGAWKDLSPSSPPDLLFRNGVAEDAGLGGLGHDGGLASLSHSITGAFAALADENVTGAADLLYRGDASALGLPNSPAQSVVTGHGDTLRSDDATRSSAAYKILR
jgi:hypothetical protein